MYGLLSFTLLVFLVSMLIWGRIERHWISIIVLVVLLISGSLTPYEIYEYANWDVLGLILGVSILTIYLEESGLSSFIAGYVVNWSRNSRLLFTIIVSMIAGFISIFMENVSVVILMFPIVVSASRILGVNPVIPSILMALSANISGSATMIGDPPAIITAGAFNLSFTDFIIYKGKPSMFFFTIISMISAILVASYLSHKHVEKENRSFMNGGNVYLRQGEKLFMLEALTALSIKIILLSLRHVLGIPLSMTAVISVGFISILRLLHHDIASITRALRNGFEWKLLLFLIGVFALSGAFEKHGLARLFAEGIIGIVGLNSAVIATTILFLNVALSSVIDNVPITVTMIPIISRLSELTSIDPVILMWSALIGLTLGGNLTYIGASANVTVVRLLEKNGYNVSFTDFMRISLVYNTVSVLIAWILYLALYFL